MSCVEQCDHGSFCAWPTGWRRRRRGMMNAWDVTKKLLALPWWERHKLYAHFGALPVDWQESTDDKVNLAAARSMRAAGVTVDDIAEAIAALNNCTAAQRDEDEEGNL